METVNRNLNGLRKSPFTADISDLIRASAL
jgi:hypothetical protein